MINKFDGQFAFLSNYFNSPIIIDGITYSTVEHFFQAQKTTDITQRKMIAAQPTPGKAKRAGRKVTLRPDWEIIKMDVMLQGLKAKFSDPILAQKLIETGDEPLEEGNLWHDNFWGVCYCTKCQDIRGQNNLGKLLKEIRKELQEEK